MSAATHLGSVAENAPHTPELSQVERSVLEFEARHPRHTPRKDDLIRRELDLSVTRYYRILGTLIESPAALEFDPLLVGRLRRMQQSRSAERAARRELRERAARAAREKSTRA